MDDIYRLLLNQLWPCTSLSISAETSSRTSFALMFLGFRFNCRWDFRNSRSVETALYHIRLLYSKPLVKCDFTLTFYRSWYLSPSLLNYLGTANTHTTGQDFHDIFLSEDRKEKNVRSLGNINIWNMYMINQYHGKVKYEVCAYLWKIQSQS